MSQRVFSVSLLLVLLIQAAAIGRGGSPLARARGVARPAANPYDGQAAAEQAGGRLFRLHCAACHGPDAAGIGKAPPLASPAVKAAAPGELFWVLRNGSLGRGMPSFSKLPEQQRWEIIAWLRRINGVTGSGRVDPGRYSSSGGTKSADFR